MDAVGDVEDVGHLVRASMYQLLAVSTVESFRLIGDRRELRISAERRQQVFRRTADFLRAFTSLPITLEDIAEAAGATVPELVDAFHSHALRDQPDDVPPRPPSQGCDGRPAGR